jgi:gamma-glutamyltranspeptidase/glutathione hydrolase/leukotriene-C4 hydrolase
VTLALNILDGFGRKHPQNMSAVDASLDIHNLAEVLKFAGAHRARISDPAFTDHSELLNQLLSANYATELRARIEKYKTFDDPAYYGGIFAQATDSGTAHISIIGPNGDAVSLTTTINHGFGAGFMGDTTGIIYNNEMADFSFQNASDPYGLPANPNNNVQPGKRPASSMAPVIFLNSKGQPVLATGGAGGSKILPAVITTIWRALYRDMDIKTAIDQPRITANFEPAEIVYEYGLLAQVVKDMERRGHRMRRLNVSSYVGNVNSVCRTRATGLILANADYRKRGTSAGF